MRYPYLNTVIYKISGIFSEQFELQHFPVDCQDLQIVVEGKENTTKTLFVPGLIREIGLAELHLKYGDHTEYEFHEPMMEFITEEQDAGFRYSSCIFRMKMERKYMVHFWKIGLSSIIIDVSSLLCFAFDFENLD